MNDLRSFAILIAVVVFAIAAFIAFFAVPDKVSLPTVIGLLAVGFAVATAANWRNP